jgi:hypothetical protein
MTHFESAAGALTLIGVAAMMWMYIAMTGAGV